MIGNNNIRENAYFEHTYFVCIGVIRNIKEEINSLHVHK